MIYHYPLIIHAQSGFRGEFPDIDGCNADGNTIDEIITNAKTVLKLHLFELLEFDEVIPLPSDPFDVKTDDQSIVTIISVNMHQNLDLSLLNHDSYIYPVVFEYAPGEDIGIYLPDFDLYSQASNEDTLLETAKEFLTIIVGSMLQDGEPLPPRTKLIDIKLDDHQKSSLVEIYLSTIRGYFPLV